MAYDDKTIQFFKFGPRIMSRYDDAIPTPFSCFANNPNTGTNLINFPPKFLSRLLSQINANVLYIIGKYIAGSWASKLGRTVTPNWDICIDGDGNFKGSYEYTNFTRPGNNQTIRGYSDG